MRRYRRLFTFLRPYRAALGASAALSMLASLLDGFSFTLLIPFLRLLFGESALGAVPTAAERGLDTVAGPLLQFESAAVALAAVMVMIVVAIVLKNLAAFGASYLAVSVQERVARDLRTSLFDHLLGLGLPYFARARGGELLARALSDADQTRQAMGAALIAVLRNGAAVLVYVGILLALSVPLTAVTLVLAPAIALTMRPVLRRVRVRVRRAAAARGDMAAVVHEALHGIRLVKSHGGQQDERRRFREATDRHVATALDAQRVALLASPLSEILGALVLAGLLAAGIQLAGLGALRAEVFITFVAITLRMLSPVKSITQFPALAAEALAGAERIFDVLDRRQDDVDPAGAAEFAGAPREIGFHDVWFAYDPGRWVLQGVDFTVRRGELVAIVGASGAGKSTLVDLLPRFIDPVRGEVRFDGVPLTAYGRDSVRRALGFVSQETVIFHDTVRANIAYGRDAGAAGDAVVAAARAANAHDFITRLPQGYDTVLGERGVRLSGGERQRIAIARALLRDAPVLVLDEATSALDAASERLVQEAIDRLLRDRTVFVIAHRASTVSRADRVFVLHDGQVTESDRHGAVEYGPAASLTGRS